MVAAFAATHMMHMTSSPPADLDLSRAKASEKGLYQVAIEPENGPLQMGVLHSWLLTLKTPPASRSKTPAITIDGGMPEHGHGLPTSPAVTANLGERQIPRRRHEVHDERLVGTALRDHGARRQRQCRVQRDAVG